MTVRMPYVHSNLQSFERATYAYKDVDGIRLELDATGSYMAPPVARLMC